MEGKRGSFINFYFINWGNQNTDINSFSVFLLIVENNLIYFGQGVVGGSGWRYFGWMDGWG